MNLWVLISLLGVAQGFLLSFVLFFHKRGNHKANIILGVLIFFFSLRLAESAGYWTTFFLNFPHLSFITVSFQFLFGLLLFFYARFLIGESSSIKVKELFHLTPFLIHLIIVMPYYFRSAEFKIAVLNRMIFTTEPIFSTRFFITEGLQNIHMLKRGMAG